MSSSGQVQQSASQQSTGGWQTSGQQQRVYPGSQSWRGTAGPFRQQQPGQPGQQRGPPPSQQRGPPSGQQGGHQQQRGSSAPAVTQVGTIKRGTVGRPGTCDVNYLNVDMSKMPEIAYHYDVGIVPERPKKFFRNAFNVFREQYLNNEIAAYDGRKSCYSVAKLPNVTGEVKVSYCLLFN